MKAHATVTIETPVRIVAIRWRRVTVELPGGERVKLAAGDVLNVEATARLNGYSS